ncbi:MAG: outer membrane beta-barrel protein [Chitinophagaceae bacterium]|nr:outer membrane beta-barrel protein [Chitinophagaceae bacterium]
MKKILLFAVAAFSFATISAQQTDSTAKPAPKKKKEKPNLSNRSNDHLVFQLGYTGWAGKPDTISTGGFSKSVNLYLMYDFPFKNNPKLSMAFGPGLASDHIIFTKTYVGIKDQTSTIHFTDQSDTNHFKKTKLATSFLEVPVEFRFSKDPENGKGLKFALGVKVGTLLNAHTRSSDFENKSGSTINNYVMKESSKRFFNKQRLSGQVRVGYGHVSLYGSYQFTPVFRDGTGPVVRPWSIGITLSGL